MTAEWANEVGVEADWLAEYGRAADLIVVGRGEAQWGPDYVLMEAALMDTGKPVLIPPRAAGASMAALNEVVGIAWKDTREAAGAVRAAMPFLQRRQPGDRLHRAGKCRRRRPVASSPREDVTLA